MVAKRLEPLSRAIDALGVLSILIVSSAATLFFNIELSADLMNQHRRFFNTIFVLCLFVFFAYGGCVATLGYLRFPAISKNRRFHLLAVILGIWAMMIGPAACLLGVYWFPVYRSCWRRDERVRLVARQFFEGATWIIVPILCGIWGTTMMLRRFM